GAAVRTKVHAARYALACSEYVRAGEAYEQAAHALPADQRAHAWWRSARSYLSAKEHAKAAAVLERFVKTDSTDAQLAEGYLNLGECYKRSEERRVGKECRSRRSRWH